jgi:hypothetical protein
VLSMSGQLDSLGQVVGGPVVGAIATMSLRAALVVTGVSLAPALALYVRAARQWSTPGDATIRPSLPNQPEPVAPDKP